MKTIYKYPFEIVDAFTLTLPVTAQILTVQLQGEVPVLWALLDNREEVSFRNFRIFGTGHTLPDRDDLTYVGTIQTKNLVWHVFVECLT